MFVVARVRQEDRESCFAHLPEFRLAVVVVRLQCVDCVRLLVRDLTGIVTGGNGSLVPRQAVGEQIGDFLLALVHGVGVELHEKRRTGPLGKRRDEFRKLGIVPGQVQKHVVHHFYGRGVVFENRCNVLHCRDDAVVGQHDECRLFGNRFQRDRRFGHDGECPLAAGHETTHVDFSPFTGVLDEHIEIIPGDVPFQVGVALLDFVGLFVEQPADLCVYLGFYRRVPVACLRGAVVYVLDIDPAEGRPCPIRKDHFTLLDVRVGLAVLQRVCTRRVVPDSAAKNALIAPRWVRCKFQAVGFELFVQSRNRDTRLCAGDTRVRVGLEKLVHVALEVEDDGLVDRLAGQARSTATGKNGDFVVVTVLHDCHDIRSRCRGDDTDW